MKAKRCSLGSPIDQLNMNRELLDDITNLTAVWYELIGGDHHKDRDCHWYVETKWSYGNTPTYKVHHFGYILDTIEQVLSLIHI